jgi:hypothetical protein
MSAKASFNVRNNPAESTIVVRMTGRFDIGTMRAFCDEFKAVTETYGGGAHYVLADMRGMLPTQPEVGLMLGSAIGFARARGLRCCAHLSDDTVQRLQVARLARQHSIGDDVTAEINSIEEGELTIRQRRERERRESQAPESVVMRTR